MAEFILNIEASSFEVKQLPGIVTDCSTIFSFELTATVGNSVRISLDNAVQTSLNFDNATFTFEGLEVEWDGADKVFTYSSPIYFSYSIANSGTPGLFKKVKAEAWDDTTTEDYNYWYQITERTNDNLPCDNPTGGILTYDELTDTPENKIGSALKLVRVNAAEDAHEYVDVGLLSSSSSQKVIQLVRFGEAVLKGDPLTITGYHGSTGPSIVEKADAIDEIKMPAYGVALEDYAINETGLMIAVGDFNDFNTSSYSVGDTLYVAVGGGMTNVKPTGTGLIQNMGIVSRSNSNNGQVEIVAIGRANDVPNLPEGRIWVGDSNTIVSDTVYIDEPNNRLGIGTTNPTGKLEVAGGDFIINADHLIKSKNALNYIDIYKASNASMRFRMGHPTVGRFQFLNNANTEVFTIDARNEKVGIGTTSPSEKLEVAGNIKTSGSLTGPALFEIIAQYANRGRITLSASTSTNANQISLLTNGVPRMVVNKEGNVGIGTTSPNHKLSVAGGNIEINNGGATWLGSDATGGFARTFNGNSFRFISSANSETMRINNATGNVGIGTTNPATKLDVRGDITITNANGSNPTDAGSLYFTESAGVWGSTQYGFRINQQGTSNYLNFQSANTTTVRDILTLARDTGNVGIGTTAPEKMLDVRGVVMSERFKVKTINNELTFPTDTGEEGEIRFTSNYIYVCVAANTWKRTELTSWSV